MIKMAALDIQEVTRISEISHTCNKYQIIVQ
jgi:hypothetical protein